MATSDILAFSEAQQYAVIGHALQHPKIWDTLREFKVDDKWLPNTLVDLYKQLESFRITFSRSPSSIDEILDFVQDDLQRGAAKRALAKCVEAKQRHPWDTLET